ncbi:hypothetical protein IQ26_05267 [Mesorhizobium tianshanense]|uniref:Uncharacterized protein n=1 Tax=Mesorhizobium tianshanense TaxID=39844 RepID=A0A562N891_9HYPH|nr:hypothetical protein IQ26_05267 [Mesorhizobium tianshanense]
MRNNADLLKHGSIFYYAYVFRWQVELGRKEGEKDRPVYVLSVIKSADACRSSRGLCYSSQIRPGRH